MAGVRQAGKGICRESYGDDGMLPAVEPEVLPDTLWTGKGGING